MSDCSIDLSANEFYSFILAHLKKLNKLEYLSFVGNPVQVNIPEFRYFVINELPRLKYLNWDTIGKEDRLFAQELEEKGVWKDKAKAVKALVKINSEYKGKVEHFKRMNSELKFEKKLKENGDHKTSENTPNNRPKRGQKVKHGTFALQRLEELLGEINDGHSSDANGLDDLLNELPLSSPKKEIIENNTKQPVSPDIVDPLDELMNEIDQITNNVSFEPENKGLVSDDLEDVLNELDSINSPLFKPTPQTDRAMGYLNKRRSLYVHNNDNPTTEAPQPLDLLDDINKVDDAGDVMNLLEDFASPRSNDVRQPNSTYMSVSEYEDLESTIDELVNEINLQKSRPSSPSGKQVQSSNDDTLDSTIDTLQGLVSSNPIAASKPYIPPPENYIKFPGQPIQPNNKSNLSSLMELTTKLSEEYNTGYDLDAMVDQLKENPEQEIQVHHVQTTNSPKPKRFPSMKDMHRSDSRVDILSLDNTRVTLSKLISKGTWGDTFEGLLNVVNLEQQRVIIKRLYSKKFSMSSIEQLKQETFDMMKLKHPNLVPILGCGVDDYKFIVRHFVEGVPLSGFLIGNSPIDFTTILNLSSRIAEALKYLHSESIIHGGLKSKNVILDRNMQPMLIDYGYLDLKDDINLINSDPEWLAPEILNGSENGYDEKIDVYSFGLLIYEMFSKSLPFHPEISTSKFLELSSKGLLRPHLQATFIPPVFEKLILACWNIESEKRPSFDIICKILSMPPEKVLVYNTTPVVDVKSKTLDEYTEEPELVEEVEEEEASLVLEKSVYANIPAKLIKLESNEKLPIEEEEKLKAVLSKLSEMLTSGDISSMTRALNVLGNLSEDVSRRNYINEKNFILILDILTFLETSHVDLTINSEEITTIELCLNTLKSLIQANTKEEVITRVMPIICTFINDAPDALKILSSQMLSNLIEFGHSEASRKNGSIYALLQMLKSENEFVQVQAAWTLSYQLVDIECQNDFIVAGGLSSLIDLKDSQNPGLNLRVFDSICTFWGNPNAESFIDKMTIRNKIIEMINSSSQIIKSIAISSLSRCCRFDDFVLSDMQALKAFTNITDYIQSSSLTIKDKIIAIQSVEIITRDPRLFHIFRDVGGVKLVVTLTALKNPSARKIIAELVRRVLQDPLCQEAFATLGGTKPLISWMLSGDIESRKLALNAVQDLIKYHKGMSSFTENAGVSIITSILAYGDEEEKMIALEVLERLTEREDMLSDIREAGSMFALKNCLNSPDPIIKLKATYTLGSMLANESNRRLILEQEYIKDYINSVRRVLDENSSFDFYNRNIINFALNAIYNIAKEDETLPFLRHTGSVELACTALEKDEILQVHALRALSALIYDLKNVSTIMATSKERLHEICDSDNETTRSQGRKILDLLNIK